MPERSAFMLPTQWWPDGGYVLVPLAVCLFAYWVAGRQSEPQDRAVVHGLFLMLVVPALFFSGAAFDSQVLCARGTGSECDTGPVTGFFWVLYGVALYGCGVALNNARVRRFPPRPKPLRPTPPAP